MGKAYLLLFFMLFACNYKHEQTEFTEIAPALKGENKQDSKFYTRPFIKDTTNTLEDSKRVLTIEYTIWGCACANWITVEDRKRYGYDRKYHFFIEPANDSLEKIQDRINLLDNYLVITGQFYKKKDFPENIVQHEEPMQKAKVFRYIDIKALKKN